MKPTDDQRRGPRERKKRSLPDFSLWIRGEAKVSEEAASSKPSRPEGGLYIVSTPIGNLGDITLRALWTLEHSDLILCEDTRKTGLLLERFGIKAPLLSCHDHNESSRIHDLFSRLKKGQVVSLVSDAGTPTLSDPGYQLVRACRKEGLPVFAVPGASALLSALACGGLPTDRFLFVGFLPPKTAGRKKRLLELSSFDSTMIFYEAPSRLAQTLADLAAVFSSSREIVICRELTKLFEEVRSGSLPEMAAAYKDFDEAKGEFVLLLGPASQEVPTEKDMESLLRQTLEKMSLRDAVAAVSSATGIKKSVVYQKALGLLA